MHRLASLFLAAAAAACAVEPANSTATGEPCTGKCDDWQTQPTDTLKAVEISSGAGHTCVTTPEGNVRCWGSNLFGESGSSLQPLKNGRWGPLWLGRLPGTMSHIVTGESTSCGYLTTSEPLPARLDDTADGVAPAPGPGEAGFSGVYCWGNPGLPTVDGAFLGNDYFKAMLLNIGGMHYGAGIASLLSGPALTAMSLGFKELCVANQAGVSCRSLTESYSLAALSEQTRRESCSVADGVEACVSMSAPVIEIAQLTSGLLHHCARSVAGQAWCWGDNMRGQFGNGTTTSSPRAAVPVSLPGGGPVTAIAAGAYITCASSASGTYCSGLNSSGQLGTGSDAIESSEWGRVELPAPADTLVASMDRVCALVDGDVYCWGLNLSPHFIDRTPRKIEGWAGPVTALSLDVDFTCGVTAQGVQCFGDVISGELGHNTFHGFEGPGPFVPSRAWLPEIDL